MPHASSPRLFRPTRAPGPTGHAAPGLWMLVVVCGAATGLAGRQPVPFVAPAATDRVAEGPRSATLEPGYGRKFATENRRPRVTISNPFMDPARPLFATAESLQCASDGSVVVSGRAGFDKDARPVATGFWRIAPDGAVTPVHARSASVPTRAVCGVPFAASSAAPTDFSLAADGRLLFTGAGAVQAVTPDGVVVRLAGAAGACGGAAPGPRPAVQVPVSDASRFAEGASRPVEDPDGNLWVADQRGCALKRITTDGEITTVLDKDALCNDAKPPEDQPWLHEMAWDAMRGELVVAGANPVAKPVHDLYTTVFRITPAGEVTRVLFAKKASRTSPAKHNLDGIRAMTVDAKGRILIVSQLMLFEQRGWDALQLMRVDEANATVVPLTGTKIRRGTWMADHPLDGPSELAVFEGTRDLCAAPDGTLYVNDDLLIRRIDPKGQVTTWAF